MSSTPFTSECAPIRNPMVTLSTDADFWLDSRLWSQGCRIRDLKSVRYETHPQIKPDRGQWSLSNPRPNIQVSRARHQRVEPANNLLGALAKDDVFAGRTRL